MDYEFKKISNVEVVAEPTDSANVLIEENGVIKKAPKSAVGGSGVSGDNFFVINATMGTGNVPMTSDTYMITDKTFEEVCNAFNDGKKLVLDFDWGDGGTHDVMFLWRYRLNDDGDSELFSFVSTDFSPENYTLTVLRAYMSWSGNHGFQVIDYSTDNLQEN